MCRKEDELLAKDHRVRNRSASELIAFWHQGLSTGTSTGHWFLNMSTSSLKWLCTTLFSFFQKWDWDILYKTCVVVKDLNSMKCYWECWQLCCCCCWVASVASDSVRPRRRQPPRLPRPWDSPGKNPGVGCHCLLQSMKVKSESEVAQSCPTLSNPMDCSLPGSSVHGIFQARVLEWGAIAFSGWHL